MQIRASILHDKRRKLYASFYPDAHVFFETPNWLILTNVVWLLKNVTNRNKGGKTFKINIDSPKYKMRMNFK